MELSHTENVFLPHVSHDGGCNGLKCRILNRAPCTGNMVCSQYRMHDHRNALKIIFLPSRKVMRVVPDNETNSIPPSADACCPMNSFPFLMCQERIGAVTGPSFFPVVTATQSLLAKRRWRMSVSLTNSSVVPTNHSEDQPWISVCGGCDETGAEKKDVLAQSIKSRPSSCLRQLAHIHSRRDIGSGRDIPWLKVKGYSREKSWSAPYFHYEMRTVSLRLVEMNLNHRA